MDNAAAPRATTAFATLDLDRPGKQVGFVMIPHSPHDDAWGVPKSVIVDRSFDWQGDLPPKIAWSETVIYEAHVKGISKLHSQVARDARGTYMGVASAPIL